MSPRWQLLPRLRQTSPEPSTDPLNRACLQIERTSEIAADAVHRRVRELLRVIGPQTVLSPIVPPNDLGSALDLLADRLVSLNAAHAWLMRAVLTAKMPTSDAVQADVREAELDGTRHLMAAILDELGDRGRTDAPWRTVEIVTGVQLVDVHHTSTATFATGIQRVTREVVRRWFQEHRPTFVGWHDDLTAMRILSEPEAHRACFGGPAAPATTRDDMVVPWQCTYIIPELAAEVVRAAHLQALGEYSGTSMNMIGYDLVPITTAETSHEGMTPGFARNLAAARHARIIVPIAVGAAEEYLGWREMLWGTGLIGPQVEPVVLPTEAPQLDTEGLAAAHRRLRIGTLPLVLVVGSHEPRKNHIAVLQAAELLWREGLQFSMTFIGGNSWNSDEFVEMLTWLQGLGRPVEAISAATDELLWGGYQLARFSVFPSINEGYGLPVAESLACGTPVITSNYGTMKEIADAGGGALLVDPRDDHSIAQGMRTLLTDNAALATLAEQASNRPPRTWDTYADETWALLAGAEQPLADH